MTILPLGAKPLRGWTGSQQPSSGEGIRTSDERAAPMDREQERERILGVVRAIAMAAMELPREKRQAFVGRTVTMIRKRYERAYGADPDSAEQARRVLELTHEMVRVLEESGGTIGHA